MSDNLLVSLFLNISLLVITAMVLTEFKPTRTVLRRQAGSPIYPLMMAVLFGVLACLSTYCGLEVEGAIANTRIVSVAAAGLLGGPIAGIGAGLIGGLHRYWYDPASYTALGCCVGTIWFGVVGACGQKLFYRTRQPKLFLVLVTVVGEGFQVLWLFLLARPISAVLRLEQTIFLPKLLMNSLGMILFFGVFDRMRQNHTDELVEYQTRALYIADQCLPYLREELDNRENLQIVAEIIRRNTPGYQVLICGRQTTAAATLPELADGALPDCAARCMADGATWVQRGTGGANVFEREDSISVPLRSGDSVVGSMTLIMDQGNLHIGATDIQLAESLAKFFSTILELHNLDYQIELRHQAEFRAFQAQINPHFFYNALNTISAFCRTKPDEARRLLVTLAAYYRHTLSVNEEFVTLEQELQNVENYLIITRARFEDALHVDCDWPADAEEFRLPPLIIQPLVENAVRHGGTAVNERRVHIHIWPQEGRMHFSIRDEGHGFPPEILAQLADPDNKKYSGLFNVSKRLLSIYGAEGALRVESTPHGSTVSFSLPFAAANPQPAKEAVPA